MLMVIVMTIGVLGMTVSVAAEPGTDQDPLITLSYLNDTFMRSAPPCRFASLCSSHCSTCVAQVIRGMMI